MPFQSIRLRIINESSLREPHGYESLLTDTETMYFPGMMVIPNLRAKPADPVMLTGEGVSRRRKVRRMDLLSPFGTS